MLPSYLKVFVYLDNQVSLTQGLPLEHSCRMEVWARGWNVKAVQDFPRSLNATGGIAIADVIIWNWNTSCARLAAQGFDNKRVWGNFANETVFEIQMVAPLRRKPPLWCIFAFCNGLNIAEVQSLLNVGFGFVCPEAMKKNIICNCRFGYTANLYILYF